MDQMNRNNRTRNKFRDKLSKGLLLFRLAKDDPNKRNQARQDDLRLNEKSLHQQIQNEVKNIMGSVRDNRSPDERLVKNMVKELIDLIVNDSKVYSCLKDLKGKDENTFRHSVNVAVLALAIGKNLGMDKQELIPLGTGAILHDIGKCKIPIEIINKPGALTKEEFTIIFTHPRLGYDILTNSDRFDKSVANIVLQHHEKWNGKGYPIGLSGQEIDLSARICTIADIYDAITSKRPYKDAVTSFDAVEYLKANSSVIVDPGIMNTFSDSIDIYKGVDRF